MSNDPLSPEHRRALEQGSAISPEVITARGYRTVTGKKDLNALGFSTAQRSVSGLLLPTHAPDGTSPSHQFRTDSPRSDNRANVVKYETPKGIGMRIDCPPACQPQRAPGAKVVADMRRF